MNKEALLEKLRGVLSDAEDLMDREDYSSIGDSYLSWAGSDITGALESAIQYIEGDENAKQN